MEASPLDSPREVRWQEKELCSNATKCVITGVVLAALTAVVAYFALTHGLTLWDAASTTLEHYQAGVLIYVGATFAFAAGANCIYMGYQLTCSDSKKSEYEPGGQIMASVLAPIAAVPVIAGTVVVVAGGCLGLGCLAIAHRRY